MKGMGPPPGEYPTDDKSQELGFKLTPDLEDPYIEEGEHQMSQEEIDDAYSEYVKEQQRQDESIEFKKQ